MTGKLQPTQPFAPTIAPQQPADYRLAQQKLRHLFQHPRSAQAIGSEYLRSRPELIDAPTLINHLCQGCDQGVTSLTAMHDRELRNWLDQRQKQDFAQGKTVRVQGWVLSQTEVELYALLALT